MWAAGSAGPLLTPIMSRPLTGQSPEKWLNTLLFLGVIYKYIYDYGTVEQSGISQRAREDLRVGREPKSHRWASRDEWMMMWLCTGSHCYIWNPVAMHPALPQRDTWSDTIVTENGTRVPHCGTLFGSVATKVKSGLHLTLLFSNSVKFKAGKVDSEAALKWLYMMSY